MFMTKHLARHGVAVDSSSLSCHPCNKERAGGFSPELQEILLCQDGFIDKKHMEDTIVHELVHLYDHAKFKVDWTDLRHVACSEVITHLSFHHAPFTISHSKQVRAANLSGDCKWDRELMRRGILGFSDHHKVRHSFVQPEHPSPTFLSHRCVCGEEQYSL